MKEPLDLREPSRYPDILWGWRFLDYLWQDMQKLIFKVPAKHRMKVIQAAQKLSEAVRLLKEVEDAK